MTSPTASAPPALGYDDLPDLLTLLRSDAKHDPSAASTLDLHWVLYDRVLNVTPETADDPERDRLLLSKGHGPASFYAVLAAKGFVPVDELAGFGSFDSRLGHHPDAALLPGVEIASGSLGHGLPIAVGRALALRAAGRQRSARRLRARRRRARRGLEPRGDRARRTAPARPPDRDRRRQLQRDLRLARRRRRRASRARAGRPPSAHVGDHDALERAIDAGVPGRPHAVVAIVEA